MLDRFFLPKRLDWIQVEVTSHCNAACIYCPRTAYQDKWVSRHLPLETFKKILPALARTRLVFLQGWGEPFLHPDFFRLVSLAKQAGCQVGTTTNGMLLDAEKITKLVELGIDTVAFSLAGIDGKNDKVRQGTSLRTVLENIQALQQAKERWGKAKPAIHIAYMLLSSGLPALAKLPSVLASLGIAQVVISTLDFVPSGELLQEALWPANLREYEDLQSQLQAVVEEGKRRHLEIHYQLHYPDKKRPTCTENVPRAMVIAGDGRVAPCVFTNLPVSGVNYWVKGREFPYQRVSFGNINESPLQVIWRQPGYRRFRHSFERGDLAPSCRDCPKLG
ncbi:MAG: hypothetical protein A2Y80_05945 [Deltaproteobacteria bacterium RBG_13_58_19]|nr:MAG: hypothetical protein A2Y80_05945 [Deltaproteobacteria bacterium RBG_13_58_19]